MAKLVVQFVAWNGEKYIPYLFKSLMEQTFTDWELRVLDNKSSDKTLMFIREAAKYLTVPVTIVENAENSGFANGHNKLWKESKGEYLALLNQDMYLDKDCFKELVEFLDTNTEYGAITPRLMKWHFEIADENLEKSKSEIIDSLGLKVFRSRRVVEFRAGDEWNPVQLEYTPVTDVFGVSGALPMYRRRALEEVAFNDGSFFDASYHSYKEDVDLAFRLRSAGFEAAAVLRAVAWHDRSAAGPKELTDSASHFNKKLQSSFVKYHSYKNHLATLYKNEYKENFFLDFPWIVWYELKKFAYYAIFDRTTLKALKELWYNRKALKAKRTFIKVKRAVDSQSIREWWTI